MSRMRWLGLGLAALAAIVIAGILLLRAERPESTTIPGDRESESAATGGAAVPPPPPREDAVAPRATPESGDPGPSEAVGRVVGIVLDPDGEPVIGAAAMAFRVPFRGKGAPGTLVALSGAEGGFRIDGLDLDGVYEVAAEDGRLLTEGDEVDVRLVDPR